MIQMMSWRATSDSFEMDDALGCDRSPSGRYHVVRWLGGYALEIVNDDCASRAAAAASMYLVRQPPRPAVTH